MNPPEALDSCPGQPSATDTKSRTVVVTFTISRTYINLAYSPIQPGGLSAFDMF